MKKVLCLLLCAAMFIGLFPVAEAEPVSEIISFGGVDYTPVGENLFKYLNFIDGEGNRISDGWYVGVNTSSVWDGNIPNPRTGENLTPLADVVLGGEAEAKGKNAFYYSSGGAEASTGNNNFLCEYVTDASLSFWNGKGSLLGYVPVEAGKTYYFSFYVSSWGSSASSSVRYGAINSDSYCQNAADGKITWSGSGEVNVDQYNGNNLTQKGSWTKREAVITAGEDADYFFFNMYWLQAADFVCVNGFTLVEIEPAEVSEIEQCRIQSYIGTEPALPSTLKVTYTTGGIGVAKAVWDDNYNIYRDGTYVVNGTAYAGGNEYPVTAEVTVYSDSLDPSYSISEEITNKNGTITADFGIYTDNTGESVFAALAIYDQDGN
ncbi:MAG: Ig-like domain-containing protein, partial [Clostridia bacterium]